MGLTASPPAIKLSRPADASVGDAGVDYSGTLRVEGNTPTLTLSVRPGEESTTTFRGVTNKE
jgi:hypothetical protein